MLEGLRRDWRDFGGPPEGLEGFWRDVRGPPEGFEGCWRASGGIGGRGEMSEMGSLVTTKMHAMISTHFTNFSDLEGLRRDFGGSPKIPEHSV